jgi:hypothetical protein
VVVSCGCEGAAAGSKQATYEAVSVEGEAEHVARDQGDQSLADNRVQPGQLHVP